MDRRGLRLEGRPLRPPADAVTVRVREGKPVLSGGPFAATAEQLAAYELLDCAGLEEAIGLASTHPMAAAGAIEVRPVWEEKVSGLGGRRGREYLVSPSGSGEDRLGKVVWSATMSVDDSSPARATRWAGCSPTLRGAGPARLTACGWSAGSTRRRWELGAGSKSPAREA